MRPSSTIRRSLAKMTLDTHRQIRTHERMHDHYKVGEREQQFQFPLTGTVGTLPIESQIDIKFDLAFLYEYGYRRDSQLLEPIARFGFTILSAPAGTVGYAHVVQWHQDADLNYKGCLVTAGMHNPLIPLAGTAPVNSMSYKATLHCSFHGYGYPLDPDMGDS